MSVERQSAGGSRRVGNTSPWRIVRGDSPLVATALHNGNEVRSELRPLLALSPAEQLREEDPYTGIWTVVAPTRVIVHSSRFEYDLNRPRDRAVYRTPEDAWGLRVWNGELPEDSVARSLELYDEFYAELHDLYSDMAERYGKFVVLDLHTYNHRRSGPGGVYDETSENPQVNIGTGTMRDRAVWADLIDRFIRDLSSFDYPTGRLDVRENVKFKGGNCARWTHATFPDNACVLSVEFKKFFMDEWTGTIEPNLLHTITDALQSTVAGLLEELERSCPQPAR